MLPSWRLTFPAGLSDCTLDEVDAIVCVAHKLVVQGVAEFAARETEASLKVTGLDAQ